MAQRNSNEWLQLIVGMLETFGANVFLIMLLIVLSGTGLYVLFMGALAIGITQLIYVIPRSIYLYRRQNWARMKGVIIAAVITALVNGGCWITFTQAGLFS